MADSRGVGGTDMSRFRLFWPPDRCKLVDLKERDTRTAGYDVKEHLYAKPKEAKP